MAVGRTTQYKGNTIVKAGVLAYLDEFIGGLNRVRVLKVFQEPDRNQSIFGTQRLVTYAQVIRTETTVMGCAGMVFTVRADDVIPGGCVRLQDGSYRLTNSSAVILG